MLAPPPGISHSCIVHSFDQHTPANGTNTLVDLLTTVTRFCRLIHGDTAVHCSRTGHLALYRDCIAVITAQEGGLRRLLLPLTPHSFFLLFSPYSWADFRFYCTCVRLPAVRSPPLRRPPACPVSSISSWQDGCITANGCAFNSGRNGWGSYSCCASRTDSCGYA